MSSLIESIKISSKSDSINATMDNLINELRLGLLLLASRNVEDVAQILDSV